MLSCSSDGGPGPSLDPLSQVLADLRLSGVSYGRCELSRPWGIEFPPQAEARFHLVAAGHCWLRATSDEWLHLEAGDVALLPRGTGHTLSDEPHGKTRSIDDLPMEEIGERTYLVREGGPGAQTILVCCSVRFSQPALHPLLELMPPALLVRGAEASDASLGPMLRAIGDEVRSQRVGAATIMTRLADVVIARVVRAWVETQQSETTGWLAAIRDPKIGRALAAIHQRPGHSWSVESLADLARSSRSTFSERFTAVVGVSPARYLARWRMHLAGMWLRNDRLTVAQAAAKLGYDSEASFSRAFKRYVGVPPSALRRKKPDEEADRRPGGRQRHSRTTVVLGPRARHPAGRRSLFGSSAGLRAARARPADEARPPQGITRGSAAAPRAAGPHLPRKAARKFRSRRRHG
jgi:AraC-like DNA-binding protein